MVSLNGAMPQGEREVMGEENRKQLRLKAWKVRHDYYLATCRPESLASKMAFEDVDGVSTEELRDIIASKNCPVCGSPDSTHHREACEFHCCCGPY